MNNEIFRKSSVLLGRKDEILAGDRNSSEKRYREAEHPE